jgi:hypothetical protein
MPTKTTAIGNGQSAIDATASINSKKTHLAFTSFSTSVLVSGYSLSQAKVYNRQPEQHISLNQRLSLRYDKE